MKQTMPQLLAEAAALERRADEAMAATDPTEMTPEAMAQLQAWLSDLDRIKGLIGLRAQLDARERRGNATPVGGGDPKFAAFAARVSITDAIAAMLGADTRGAGMAREASAEIARQRNKPARGIYVSMGSQAAAERRATLTSGAQGTPPTGSPLIPTFVRGDLLIDALRSALVLEDLGATFLTGLTGNVSVPRATRGTQVGWFAENAPIPDTDLAFDGVLLTMKHVGAISEYSRNMVLSATPDIDALIRADLMRALAVEIERAALAGTGDGVQPRGILNTPGIGTVSMGNALTWAGVLAMPATVGGANVPMGRPGFVGSSLVRAKAMATQSVPGVASPFIMTDAETMAGYKFATTNQVPVTPAGSKTPALSTLIFAAWENLLVGVWDALDLVSNPWGDEAFRRGNVQVRIIADLDVNVRHPEAFAVATDVAA